jgi:hypothetical protein
MIFENKVMRKIFGPKRNEVRQEWRRLHNKKLHALYYSPNIIWVIKSRRIRRAGFHACTGQRRGAYTTWFFYGKPLRRPRRIGANNIKIDLQEVG